MLKKTVLAGSLLLAGGLAFGPAAHAGYIVTLAQVGSNVVATGTGSIDFNDLSFDATAPAGPATISPFEADIFAGSAGGLSVDVYLGIVGPATFGVGGPRAVSSGTGDVVGIANDFALPRIAVPHGYVSGSSLSSTATWDNQTFATLGVTPGTYVWTWGRGVDADSFTINAVPEPGSLALLATALIGIGAIGFSRRRRA